MNAEHHCDPAIEPAGGLLTQARVLRIVLACMGSGSSIEVIDEVGACEQCRDRFVATLAMFAAALVLERNPDAKMHLELQLSAVESAIDRGGVEVDDQ